MKKILILSHTQGYSDFKIGSHHYANGLSKCGHEVYYSGIPETIFHKLLNKRKQKGTKKINESVIDSQIDSFFPLTLKKNSLFLAINSAFFYFYEKNKLFNNVNFDVVVCDYPYFQPLLSKINFKKLIYRPTDDYVAMMGGKTINYENEICENADIIVATSEVVSDKIVERYSTNPNKIHVITNGYDEIHFQNKLENNSLRKDAIYIGALDSRFDFDALKHLASNRENVVFNIFGPLSQDYLQRKPEFDMLSNVIFHGKVDYEDTNNLMNQHKVGLLLLTDIPSNKGRSPMKLWEYIATGLNVVYSNIDGVSESACLFKYDNYQEMLEVFDKAYEKENSHDDQILKDHSWNGKVMKLEKLSLS